jgi:general secretion pathway protein C
MKRPWITALNWLLAGGAIFLLGFSVAQVVEAMMNEVVLSNPEQGPPPAPSEKIWADRARIIDRNLFNASTLAPTNVEQSESYERSRLPLKLLATLASGEASWASFEDTGSRHHYVAQVNAPVCRASEFVPCSYGGVIVQRVERCRVVLQNQGRREELVLEGAAACKEGGGPIARARPSPATASGRGVRNAVERLAENRFAVPREEVENAAQNPAALYSQARILPRYAEGKMIGVQLNAIRPGSLFAQVGIQDGDTVTQVNGVTVATPEDGQRLLQEFSSGGELRVTVQGRDGQVRELSYVAQ